MLTALRSVRSRCRCDAESDYPYFADDVILVTPNSRLSGFGYFGSDELRGRVTRLEPCPVSAHCAVFVYPCFVTTRMSVTGLSASNGTGNNGILDQRLALRWVADNIDAFGGNASSVTLMGESSGGTCAGVHVVTPESWGLFHRARA